MLEYCLRIIKAVAFDKRLFIKEYRKALKWLDEHESSQLKQMIRQDNYFAGQTANNAIV
jgi:hypothetical protein